MSVFERAKVKIQEWFGRAEEVYGEAHGDAAAEVGGEARRLEGEAEEDALDREERRDDDGLSGQGAVR
jgi:uncharacterized protein YjbJ (UPF0337 family)